MLFHTTNVFIGRHRFKPLHNPPNVNADVDNDEMDVVGHTNEFIALYAGKFVFQFGVPLAYHATGIVQSHYTTGNVTKQEFPVLGTNGYEIWRRLRIIVTR